MDVEKLQALQPKLGQHKRVSGWGDRVSPDQPQTDPPRRGDASASSLPSRCSPIHIDGSGRSGQRYPAGVTCTSCSNVPRRSCGTKAIGFSPTSPAHASAPAASALGCLARIAAVRFARHGRRRRLARARIRSAEGLPGASGLALLAVCYIDVPTPFLPDDGCISRCGMNRWVCEGCHLCSLAVVAERRMLFSRSVTFVYAWTPLSGVDTFFQVVSSVPRALSKEGHH